MDSEDEEFMDKIEKELASEHGWLGEWKMSSLNFCALIVSFLQVICSN